MKEKIAIIGCGNLGKSILNGLLNTKEISPNNITVTKRNLKSLERHPNKSFNKTCNNIDAVFNSELIILAIKPYNLISVLNEIKSKIDTNKHIIVSLATGISIKEIEAVLPQNTPIYRAMPNTAADVSESITCICSNINDQENNNKVRGIFNSIGSSIFINEDLMESATVLGACGIAYVLRFIRAMIQGGIQIGFDAKTANEIVTQTVKGASELLIKNKQHPEFEIDKVTTPKGCTIVGINEMEHNGFSSSLIKGLMASYNDIKNNED